MDHSRVYAVVWLAKLAWVLPNWSLREGQNSYSASSCWAATLVTHSHELVIRNVWSHEEVSGSGWLDCVSALLMLFIRDRWLSPCRVVPACFFGTVLNLCTCVLSQRSLASSSPEKPSPLCVVENDSLRSTFSVGVSVDINCGWAHG